MQLPGPLKPALAPTAPELVAQAKAYIPTSEMDESLVAIDMEPPTFVQTEFKNPMNIGYWGNRHATEKNPNWRLSRLMAMGYRPAMESDLTPACAKRLEGCKAVDGKYIVDDLILLVTTKVNHYGRLKANRLKAEHRARPVTASEVKNSIVAESGASLRNPALAKIQPFVPGEAEVKALTGETAEEEALNAKAERRF